MGRGCMPKINASGSPHAVGGCSSMSMSAVGRSPKQGAEIEGMLGGKSPPPQSQLLETQSFAPSMSAMSAMSASQQGHPNTVVDCLRRVEDYQLSSLAMQKKARKATKSSAATLTTNPTSSAGEMRNLQEAIFPLQRAIKMVEAFQKMRSSSSFSNTFSELEYSQRSSSRGWSPTLVSPVASAAAASSSSGVKENVLNPSNPSSSPINHNSSSSSIPLLFGEIPSLAIATATTPGNNTRGSSKMLRGAASSSSGGEGGRGGGLGSVSGGEQHLTGHMHRRGVSRTASPAHDPESREDVVLRLTLSQLYCKEGELLVQKNNGILSTEAERELSKGTLMMTTVLIQQGFICKVSDHQLVERVSAANANRRKPTSLMKQAQQVATSPVPAGRSSSNSSTTAPFTISPSARTALPPFLTFTKKNNDLRRRTSGPLPPKAVLLKRRRREGSSPSNNNSNNINNTSYTSKTSTTTTEDDTESDGDDDDDAGEEGELMEELEVRKLVKNWRDACMLLCTRYIATAYSAKSLKDKQNRCRMAIRMLTRCILALKDVGAVDGTEDSLATELADLLVALGKAYVIYEFFVEGLQCAEQALIARPDFTAGLQLEKLVKKHAEKSALFSAAMALQRCYRLFKAKCLARELQVRRQTVAVLVCAAMCQLAFTANAFPKPSSLQVFLSSQGYYKLHGQLKKSGILSLEDLAGVSDRQAVSMGLRVTVAKTLIQDAKKALVAKEEEEEKKKEMKMAMRNENNSPNTNQQATKEEEGQVVGVALEEKPPSAPSSSQPDKTQENHQRGEVQATGMVQGEAGDEKRQQQTRSPTSSTVPVVPLSSVNGNFSPIKEKEKTPNREEKKADSKTEASSSTAASADFPLSNSIASAIEEASASFSARSPARSPSTTELELRRRSRSPQSKRSSIIVAGSSGAGGGGGGDQQGAASKKRQAIEYAIANDAKQHGGQNPGTEELLLEHLTFLQESEHQTRCQIESLFFGTIAEILSGSGTINNYGHGNNNNTTNNASMVLVESFYVALWQQEVYVQFCLQELCRRNQVVAAWWTKGVALRRKLELKAILLNPDAGLDEETSDVQRFSSSEQQAKNDGSGLAGGETTTVSNLYHLLFSSVEEDHQLTYNLFTDEQVDCGFRKDLKREVAFCCCPPPPE